MHAMPTPTLDRGPGGAMIRTTSPSVLSCAPTSVKLLIELMFSVYSNVNSSTDIHLTQFPCGI